jgi:very-short-patch-repair endonuclease
MKIYHYNSKLKKLAQQLRKTSTLGEILLWQKLKGRQMHGYQFFRQKPIANFVVDFFSKELKLIIEIEGHSHEGKFLKDEVRQKKLEALGFTVLRFSESQIKKILMR